MIERDEHPHVPVSVNIITKDNPESTIKTLDSVMGALDPDQLGLDQIVVVDTGSTRKNLTALSKGLEDFKNVNLVRAGTLAKTYEHYISKYLGRMHVERFREMVEGGKCSVDGLMNFAAARRVAKENSSHDIIFWIDSDDVIVEEEPGKLRNVLNAVFGEEAQKAKNIGVLMLDYDYAFAPDGACTTMLRRERFVRKDTFDWVGACHETLIPKPGANPGTIAYFGDLKSKIVHSHNDKPTSWADMRNFIIISEDMERQKEAGEVVDPRSYYYLGNAARGLRLHKTALGLYKEFDRISGSTDDRFAANYFRGSIYLDGEMQRPFDALDAYMECVKCKPDDPRGYFGLQRAYLVLQRWDESLMWFDMGQRKQMADNQVMSYDPTHVHYFPFFFAAHAAQEKGDFSIMMQCAQKAAANRPGFEEAQLLLKNAQGRAAAHQLTQGVLFTAKHLKNTSPTALVDQMAVVPPDLEKMGLAQTETEDGRPAKKELAIFCGPTAEEWGPGSRATGIGGSEKMVVILAEEIQRSGLANVSVYASVPREQRGISADTGVRWEHWGAIDISRPRHALVFWRCPGMVANIKAPAKVRMVWNHDVQNPETYTPYVCAKLDIIQCQSNFHAEPLRDVVPDSKLWVARNAIETPATRPALKRNPKQVVFCSSPDRGIKTAAEIVRRAQLLDPEISLVTTYGMNEWVRKQFARNNHRHVPDVGHEMCMDLYEREVHAALDAIDATNMNRVSWEAMEVLMQSSGVWLYPTRFDEISCMSAMEALANGLVVVATRYAALAETLGRDEDVVGSLDLTLDKINTEGELSDAWLDDAAQKLFKACNEIPADHAAREVQARVALKRFNVGDLAKMWIDKLGLGENLLAAEDNRQVGSVRPDPALSKEKHGRAKEGGSAGRHHLPANPRRQGSVRRGKDTTDSSKGAPTHATKGSGA